MEGYGIQSAIELLARIPQPLINLLSFFFGFLAGHRLEVARERRREFNAAVTPLRDYVLNEMNQPYSLLSRHPTVIQVDAFECCLPWYWRSGFRRAWNAQLRERQQGGGEYDTGTGSVRAEYARYVSALRKCLRYLRRR